MNTPISKINLNRLSVTDYIQMMKNLKSFIDQFGANRLGITAFYKPFVRLLDTAIAALASEKSSGITPAMQAGDLLRDNDYKVLYYVVKGYTYSRYPEIREAANQLMRIFKDDANPLTASLDTETTLLDNIVMQLRNEPYTGYLNTLHAASLLSDIAQSNETYAALDKNRTREKSVKMPGNVKSVYAELNPVYRNIISTVNMLAKENPTSAELDQFTSLVEADVKHYMSLIARHETILKNKNDKNRPADGQPE